MIEFYYIFELLSAGRIGVARHAVALAVNSAMSATQHANESLCAIASMKFSDTHKMSLNTLCARVYVYRVVKAAEMKKRKIVEIVKKVMLINL